MPPRKTASRKASSRKTTSRAPATRRTSQTAASRKRRAAAAQPARAAKSAGARSAPSEAAQNVYLVGLRNAHAMEQEALQVMSRQVERLEHYPDVAKRLRSHIAETERQVKRLDSIMEQHGSSRSTLKDIALQLMGNMAALGNALAGDEILKNAFANNALEAFEIAAYKSLITLAEKQGDRKALPLLKASLREEEQMAAWADKNIAKVTMDYVKREEQDKQANR